MRAYIYSIIALLILLISCPAWSDKTPTFKIDQVTITANRYPNYKLKSPWSISVVGNDFIKKYSFFNAAQALSYSAGVETKTSGGLGSTSTIRLRGGTAQQSLVLIDGQPINSPLLGTVDLGDILIDSVEKIEIVKSPISALYGADAAFGAVNVITKDKTNSDQPLALEIKLGSFNTQKYSLQTSGKYNGIDYLVDAIRLTSDGYRENSAVDTQNYITDFKMKDENNLYRLRAINVISLKGVPGVPTTEGSPFYASTPFDTQFDNNSYVMFDWQRQLAGKTNLDFKFYLNNLSLDWHNYNTFSKQFEDTNYLAWENGINFEISKVFKDKVRLSSGFELKNVRGDNSSIGEKAISNIAFYFNEEVGINQPFNLNLGVRIDKHSITGTSINPRLGILFYLTDNFGLKSSVSFGYRAPTLNELYWSDPVWQMYGNQNLKPEQSTAFEVGANYKADNTLEIQTTYFVMQTDNLIVWDWNPTTFITQAKNIGSSLSQGCEFEYRKKINRNFSSFINLTAQRVITLNDSNSSNIGKYIPYSPDCAYQSGLNWENEEGMQVSLNLKGKSQRFADTGNTIRVAPYHTFNFQLSHENYDRTITFSIDNLTDQQYYETIGYSLINYQPIGYPMPGRSYYISYRTYL